MVDVAHKTKLPRVLSWSIVKITGSENSLKYGSKNIKEEVIDVFVQDHCQIISNWQGNKFLTYRSWNITENVSNIILGYHRLSQGISKNTQDCHYKPKLLLKPVSFSPKNCKTAWYCNSAF